MKDPGKGMVHIIRSDKKYHRCSCSLVKYNPIKISVKDAKKMGYTPCELCKPEKK